MPCVRLTEMIACDIMKCNEKVDVFGGVGSDGDVVDAAGTR